MCERNVLRCAIQEEMMGRRGKKISEEGQRKASSDHCIQMGKKKGENNGEPTAALRHFFSIRGHE